MSTSRRITVPVLKGRKSSKDKSASPIYSLTAYDYTLARLIDRAGVDLILVGDSLGMVVQGHSSTLPVSLEETSYHTRCVRRGVERALLVSDMPFLSYQPSLETAINSAGRLLKDGAAAVKLEGGVVVADTVHKLTSLDIPVMGHIGMTPQSVHRMGGFRIQGKSRKSGGDYQAGTWEQIIEDALAIEQAGAFSIVIEAVPAELAAEVTAKVSVPVIGIATDCPCDGKILVAHDLLGITTDDRPAFVKPLANLGEQIMQVVKDYCQG